MTCLRCKREIDNPKLNAYPQMIGYSVPKGRRAGEKSGSSIKLRKATGKVLCAACMVELEHGPAAGYQAPLL